MERTARETITLLRTRNKQRRYVFGLNDLVQLRQRVMDWT
jgi:hypothetical protein